MALEVKYMNNKGFTLIELLVTIALLAVLSIISFVSINAVIEKSRVNDCNSIKENIKSTAKEYLSDHRYSPSSERLGNAQQLIDANYLTGPIVNPFTKEKVDASDIKITYELNSNGTVKSVSASGSFLNECSK